MTMELENGGLAENQEFINHFDTFDLSCCNFSSAQTLLWYLERISTPTQIWVLLSFSQSVFTHHSSHPIELLYFEILYLCLTFCGTFWHTNFWGSQRYIRYIFDERPKRQSPAIKSYGCGSTCILFFVSLYYCLCGICFFFFRRKNDPSALAMDLILCAWNGILSALFLITSCLKNGNVDPIFLPNEDKKLLKKQYRD